MDSQTQMKQIVADAAIKEVKSGMVLGLGSGSIYYLSKYLKGILFLSELFQLHLAKL